MATQDFRTVDQSADQLYELYASELMRFATSLVGPADAGDVVHDAVVSLFRSEALWHATNPRALLYRAVLAKAKSQHRSLFRRRARERKFAVALTVPESELRPEVLAAVVDLSEQQRACVFLTYWEDLAAHDVAERLGIAEGTVKAHLARARSRLRAVLGHHHDG